MLNKVDAVLTRGWTRWYYAPQFARIGAKSTLRSPVFLKDTKRVRIGSDSHVRDGVRLEAIARPGLPPGRIEIGDRVHIEQNVHIVACDEILIEDEVLIAANVAIVDTTHLPGRDGDGNRSGLISNGRSRVRIGRRAFIGINSVILPNVSIGANAMVGAGSVVTRDVPPNAVVAGAPAVVIRELPG